MALQSSKIKAVADIVLCVDCTGSMQPCIDGLKSQLSTFIEGLQAPKDQSLPPIKWRLRVIGFRDLRIDGEPAWVNLDSKMVDTVSDARAQLEALQPEGGGDSPESALDALWYAASKTEWRDKCTKVVILFSDATTHPDLHLSTKEAGAVACDLSAVTQVFAEKGIWLRAFVAKCETWESFQIPKAVFNYIGDAAGLETINFEETLALLAKVVSQASQADAVSRTVAVA